MGWMGTLCPASQKPTNRPNYAVAAFAPEGRSPYGSKATWSGVVFNGLDEEYWILRLGKRPLWPMTSKKFGNDKRTLLHHQDGPINSIT